jgi:hypothetical protein
MIHALLRSTWIIRSLLSGLRRRRGRPSAWLSAPRGAAAVRPSAAAAALSVANDEHRNIRPFFMLHLGQRFACAPALPLPKASADRAEGPQARLRAAPHGAEKPKARMRRRRLRLNTDQACCASLSFAGPVAGAKSIKPDPISNSAVKLFSADGTVSQDPGE